MAYLLIMEMVPEMTAKFFEVQKKLYLADTDATGIAYYARHLEWLEMARVEFIAEIYKPLTRMIAEDGVSFMPISVKIDYKAPAVFEDLLAIKVGIKAVEKIKLLLEYEISKQTGGKEVLVSQAEITMLCINTLKGNKPSKIPENLITVFQEWQERIEWGRNGNNSRVGEW